MKKLICLLLAVIMCLGVFAACGNKAAEQTDPPKQTDKPDTPETTEAPKEPVTVVWGRYGLYEEGDHEKAQEAVEAALNEYLAEKWGIVVDMRCYTMAEWNEKTPLEIGAGTDMDVLSCGSGIGGIGLADAIRQGVALDITDMLEDHPALKASLTEGTWNIAGLNGRIHSVPINNVSPSGWGYIVNQNFIDKYGWDVSKMKTYDDMEPMLDDLAKDPDCAFAFFPCQYTLMGLNEVAFVANSHFAYVELEGDTKIKLVQESEHYKKWAERMQKWAKAGYWPEDLSVNEQSYKEQRNEGKYGTYFVYGNSPTRVAAETARYSVPCQVIDLSRFWNRSSLPAGQIINAKSPVPDAALTLIEALHTDPVVADLAMYGIEDEHYTRDANNQVTLIENSGYRIDSWSCVSTNIRSLLSTEDPDTVALTAEFEKSGEDQICSGFVFDNTAVAAEQKAMTEVWSAYDRMFQMTIIDDLDAMLAEYVQALKDAGAEKWLAEMQRQFDEFLAGKGK